MKKKLEDHIRKIIKYDPQKAEKNLAQHDWNGRYTGADGKGETIVREVHNG